MKEENNFDQKYSSYKSLLYDILVIKLFINTETQISLMLESSTVRNELEIRGLAFESAVECIHKWKKETTARDGQNHHMLMILKSKSNHLNKGDLKSKSKSF